MDEAKKVEALHEIIGWLMLNRESFPENLDAHDGNVAASVIDLLAFGFEQEAIVDSIREAIA